MGTRGSVAGLVRVLPAALAVSVFVASPAARARTYTVNAGGNLQAALDAAQPGDQIVLQAGARFVGSFRLPAKPAGPVITIRSSVTLPDRRVTPGDAALLPTLASPTVEPAVRGTGVANWRLDGLRFESTSNGEGDIVRLHGVTNITLDRLLIVAGTAGQKRAVTGNGRQITLTRSHIANIWKSGQDSQAFCAWDGAGPYTITDNYLEAASENVLFGGANSASAERVPSDILIERNHLTKSYTWKGQPRVVKNLLELKSARRVVVRQNLFERNWTDGQSGWAIVLKAMNDEGGSPWAVVEDVLFEGNVVRDTENGINVLGYDSYKPSGRTTGIRIRHNLILASGTFLQVGGEVGELTVDHNTVDQGGTFAVLYTGDVWVAGTPAVRPAQFAVERLTLTNTLANHGTYGLIGAASGMGTPALEAMTSMYSWTHNVLAGGGSQQYPALTLRPSVPEHRANFTADYKLVSGSRYRNAGSDGENLGASLGAVGGLLAPRNFRILY